ncbi:MAG: MMPL family transporter [Candidatus Njordarchaeia archaeon]
MSKIERFASFVMSKSKMFLAVYVIVALLLVPYAKKSTQELTTNEASYLPSDIESQIANNILTDSFNNTDEFGIVIVLHSKNNTNLFTHQTYSLVNEIRNWILNNWTVNGEAIVSNVSDFFTFARGIYNATIWYYNYQIMYVNMTDSIIWGLPYVFGVTWQTIYSTTGDIATADSGASATMNATAQLMIEAIKNNSNISPNVSEEMEGFIRGYTNAFIQTWNYMRNDPVYQFALPPNQPVSTSVTIIVQNIVANMLSLMGGSIPWSFRYLLNRTATMLNYTTWMDETHVFNLTLDYLNHIYNVSVGDEYERGFILGIFNSTVFKNRSVYWHYYWEILQENKYPSLFPAEPYKFVRDLYVSKDRDTLIMTVSVSEKASSLKSSEFEPYIDSLRSYLKTKESGNLEILATGTIPFIVDNTVNAKEDVERIDLITFALALLLLLVIYRGVPVSVFPLILMGLTIIIARAVLVFLSGLVGLEINDVTLAMMTTVIIGAGVDYTIFLISRYSEDRRRGRDKEDSIVSVVKHAGKSVLLSGGTVIIAFGSLMLSSFDFLKHVGMGIMTGVGITLFVALTLTPSILTIFGDKIFWPSHRTYNHSGKYKEGKYEKVLRKIGKWTIKHSKTVILLALIVTLPATYIYQSYGTTYDFMALTREGTPSKTGFNLLRNEIGSQAFSATEVVAVFKNINFTTDSGGINVTLVEKYIKPISTQVSNIEGVKSVRSAYEPMGSPMANKMLENMTLEDFMVQSAARSYISKNGSIVLITVYLEPEPYSSKAFHVIDKIREKLKDIKSNMGTEVEFYVGGLSATYKDISDIVNADFNVLVTFVIIGIILFLFVALRSVLIPIRLEITILLSIVWAISLSMVFWGFYANLKLVWFIPLFMFTVLNGLGMDYDIFLVTRIEEERIEKKRNEEDAIVEAIASTGKIISIAGIIMAAAFGSLLLTLSPPTRQIGLTLALGVLIDAFIVRIILVPAIMAIAGKWNWWPRKISAIKESEG